MSIAANKTKQYTNKQLTKQKTQTEKLENKQRIIHFF